MESYEQHDSHPPLQHLFCPQSQQLGPHYGGPALGIWCERCRPAGHEAKMCAALIPRSPPQYSGSHCFRAKPFVRHYSGGDGIALSPQQQPALRPSLDLAGSRGTTVATVQRCDRSSTQAPAPSLALAGRRTTTATVQHCVRSSS